MMTKRMGLHNDAPRDWVGLDDVQLHGNGLLDHEDSLDNEDPLDDDDGGDLLDDEQMGLHDDAPPD